MRIKVRNVLVACGLGLCLCGAGVGIGYSIKANNQISEVQAQLSEESEETTIEKLKAKLDEILESKYVSLIVSGGTTAAGIISFIITFVKYKKYKSLSSQDIADLVTKVTSEDITAKYEELEKKLVNELINKFGSVEETLNYVTTALVMMQDTTTKGRAALVEYLAKKTKESENATEESKEIIEEVQETVTEEVEKEEEVTEEVEKDYDPVE